MNVTRRDAEVSTNRDTIIIELDELEASKLATVLRVGMTMFGLFESERSIAYRLRRDIAALLGD